MRVRPSRTETRLLVAVLVAATALGPVVAAFSAAPDRPAVGAAYVLLPPPPPAADVQQVCATPAVADDCAALQARLRLSGVGPAMLSLVPVLLLLVLAVGLRRGRRAALRGAVAANLALAVLGAGLGWTVLRTPVERLVAVQRSRRRAVRAGDGAPAVDAAGRGGGAADHPAPVHGACPRGHLPACRDRRGTALVAVSAVYLVGGTLLADGFDRPPSTSLLLVSLPFRFVPPGYLAEVTPRSCPGPSPATLLYEWTGVRVLAGRARRRCCGASSRARAHAADADARRARRLIERDGGSLSWMATWPGNGYWFTPARAPRRLPRDRRRRAHHRRPVRRPGARRRRGRRVRRVLRRARLDARASTASPHAIRDQAAAAGLVRAVQVAEETVLRAAGLAFTGKKWQDVRTALNKAAQGRHHRGVDRLRGTRRWRSTDQIRAISEEWVADKGLPEMGFTLGGLDELARRRRALPASPSTPTARCTA